METRRYKIVRTLRCKDLNIPGTLRKVTTAIGSVGAEIGNIATIHMGYHYIVRDIDALVESEEHLASLIDEVSKLYEVSILQLRDEVLELHKSGKIKMMNTVPINSLTDLRKVYTPGVADVCRLIMEKPSLKDAYTR